ncbi:heterokaryon incompatibility protein-domain-containing protein [Lophiotrema nucula]|uniref:Heterokaryon incompatibility protein-domain-containing protein n=1 Tax=Lophiotrema nucula TaxID=690887 RepID=A0A6A5ZU17_9PLEO|nr:heterokaryon incompatibility protein-domain-containing protein [Lophiotrema nucula]
MVVDGYSRDYSYAFSIQFDRETPVQLVDLTSIFFFSYTWDSPGNEKVIHVDNCKKKVMPSLHNFIRRLRAERAPRALWADAICINQNDTVEKNLQVRQMGDIYRRASCVLAWVGEHENRSKELFRGWPREANPSAVRRYMSSVTLSRKEQAYRKSPSLASFVREYGMMTDCANPRDKIYAFIGMANNPVASKMVPDYGASTAEVFLQFWLLYYGRPGFLMGGVGQPGPYMLLLAFDYTDDCQFADYLLDDFDRECFDLFHDRSRDRSSLRMCHETYLNAIQALWDGGLQSLSRKLLGHFLPPKEPWYKPVTKGPDGWRWLTAEERDNDNARRLREHKQKLMECRDDLRARGMWPKTRAMAFSPHSFPTNNTRLGAQASATPQGGPRIGQETYAQFQQGTQPHPYLDADDNVVISGRRWYQGRKDWAFERPSVVNNSAMKEEFSRTFCTTSHFV